MKYVRTLILLSLLFACFSGSSLGQCSSPVLNGFSITPNVIAGDQSQFAIGTVQACVPSGLANLSVNISTVQVSTTKTVCNGGEAVVGGCNYYGVGSGNVTVAFQINAYNYSGQITSGNVTVSLNSPNTDGSAPLTVTSAATPYEPPIRTLTDPARTAVKPGVP
jgi:hypothetical protein